MVGFDIDYVNKCKLYYSNFVTSSFPRTSAADHSKMVFITWLFLLRACICLDSL